MALRRTMKSMEAELGAAAAGFHFASSPAGPPARWSEISHKTTKGLNIGFIGELVKS